MFQQKLDKASPRQMRHSEFIAQFTTDIRYIPGKDNIIADTMSRIDAIHTPNTIDFAELAKFQKSDSEFKELLNSNSSLQIKPFTVPGTDIEIFCDVSTSNT